jgi:3-deoxy-7-phosphoheptulonate synthase
MEIARIVAEQGLKFFRGGAFKPRTSPYSFQGLGQGGLELLKKVKANFGLRTVSEVLEPDAADMAAEYVDVLQIGTRNMYNYPLLRKVGELGKPVLLKRGMSATLEEFLFAAEYIASHGNFNIILCERGIRTFSDYTRNTFDINVIPVVKQISHLPIVADPSHACGDRRHVLPLARAALAAGADGLVVEVHQDPETAYSDGAQSLYPMQLKQLQKDVDVIQEITKQA